MLRVWAKRNNDLGRLRNKAACRLHSVLCDLVAGGIATEISADTSEQLLENVAPANALEAAKAELAAELIADVRHLDEQMVASKRRIAAAVKASGTTLTQLYGVGPVVAAMLIAYSGNIGRFASRDHYAAYTGTAPVEVSSGGRQIHRVSRRGNRQLNHALHIAAISQIRHPGTEGRTYYERKLAEGKTPKDAIRALKRRIIDAVYRQLRADAQRRSAAERAREDKRGTTQQPARPALTPNTGSSAKPLPGPTPRYDPVQPRRARRSRPAALASRST